MKDGYTNNTFVSLCCDEEFSSLRDEAVYVNDGILSILLESSPNGDLDVPVGLPIHQIFSWPYEGVTRSHMWMCYGILSRDQRLRGHVRNILAYSRAWVFVLTAGAHHLYVSILI
jgi:hypothetical protein